VAVSAQDARTKPHGIAWWRRGIVVLGALTAVAAAVWCSAESDPSVHFLYWPWVGIALAPVVVPGARAFRRWCLGAGLVILLAGVVFVLWGLFAFAPSGFVLLSASLTDRRPLTRPLGLAGLLIGLVALVWWTVTLTHLFRPPDVFVVQFDQQGYRNSFGVLHRLEFNPPSFDHGATAISVGDAEWAVSFRDDLSRQERVSLEAYLRGLPAVTSVRLCDSPRDCGR
jgi:hypothetical protein